MRGKITKRSVDALKQAADGVEAVLWDSELKGFGVRMQRGGARSYVLHYRAGTGRGAPPAQADDRPARLTLDGGDGAQRGQAAARIGGEWCRPRRR